MHIIWKRNRHTVVRPNFFHTEKEVYALYTDMENSTQLQIWRKKTKQK